MKLLRFLLQLLGVTLSIAAIQCEVSSRSALLYSFDNRWWLKKQKREVGECPCVKAKGSSGDSGACVAYDGERLAATLDEAINNFPNLLAVNQDQITLRPQRTSSNVVIDGSRPLDCRDDECRMCMKLYLASFRQQTTAAATTSEGINRTLAEIDELYQRLDLQNINASADSCKWFTIHNDKPVTETPIKVIDVGEESLQEILKLVQGTDAPNAKKAVDPTDGSGVRNKREYLDPAFETSWVLETKYRGQPLEDGSNWHGLCNMCWKFGILGNKYFPQYINIMSCDSDTRCLSGYGKCIERTRSVSVLRNGGSADSPDWQLYSLSVPVACECQVQPDSVLANLAKS